MEAGFCIGDRIQLQLWPDILRQTQEEFLRMLEWKTNRT